MLSREQIQIKTPEQVRLMRRAGLVVADIHAALREAVRAGITTGELDAVSAGVIEAAGAHSNFLGYYDYPATVCISVNDEVVHGIPGERVLVDGDLVTFDCGAYVVDDDGTQWHGDAAFTTVVGGTYRNETDRLVDSTTREALWAAIAAVARAAAGEKTMLDAWRPALEALRAHPGDLAAGVAAAARAAAAGRDATKPMVATKGRASYLGERSVGHIDPGAASTALILAALDDVVAGRTA